mmetsp:Transcript_38296/g.108285  ORF Transcript_38296/g.108285 Transcript_38296/m.108285 type:complete len:231 (+) Transcript_38296:91-783(+)
MTTKVLKALFAERLQTPSRAEQMPETELLLYDDLPWLRLPDVAHRAPRLSRLEGGVAAVGFGDAQLLWDVRVGARLRRSLEGLPGRLRHLLGLHRSLVHELEGDPLTVLAEPLALRVRGRSLPVRKPDLGVLRFLSQVIPLSLQLDGSCLVHGELADGCHELAGDCTYAGLVVVDLLGQLQGVRPSLSCLLAEAVTEAGDLLQDELLLKQLLLLVVQPLLQLVHLGLQLL